MSINFVRNEEDDKKRKNKIEMKSAVSWQTLSDILPKIYIFYLITDVRWKISFTLIIILQNIIIINEQIRCIHSH